MAGRICTCSSQASAKSALPVTCRYENVCCQRWNAGGSVSRMWSVMGRKSCPGASSASESAARTSSGVNNCSTSARKQRMSQSSGQTAVRSLRAGRSLEADHERELPPTDAQRHEHLTQTEMPERAEMRTRRWNCAMPSSSPRAPSSSTSSSPSVGLISSSSSSKVMLLTAVYCSTPTKYDSTSIPLALVHQLQQSHGWSAGAVSAAACA